jgi:hypothetical protein
MNRMKKIGAFFAVCLLLVGCEAGKKPAPSGSQQQPVNRTGTQWNGRNDRGKTGNVRSGRIGSGNGLPESIGSAQRFEVKDGKLLIYIAGSDAPLRFHGAAAREK